MKIGIQLFPYDIADQGAEDVLRRAAIAGVETVLPAVNYIREDQPVPTGELPHNPVRKRHISDGGVYFEPRSSQYPKDLLPPVTAEIDNAGDSLLALLKEADRTGVEFVPWLSLLNGAVADRVGDATVINAEGQPVKGWLCPSSPLSQAYVRGLIEDTLALLGPRPIFIDRIRYPEWGANGLDDALTCFCPDCARAAEEAGIDVEAVRSALSAGRAWLASAAIDELPSPQLKLLASGASWLRVVAARGEVVKWLRFRQDQVERMVGIAADEAARHGGSLWLDVWPPSYGWLLGQDLSRMGPFGAWVKPFTYHRLAGGADIAGFISSLAENDNGKQRMYEAYLRFFGFPGPRDFEEFADRGLDPEFVTQETALAKKMIGGQSALAAGLQLWRVGPEGARTAVERALLAEPEGIFFFCYGWATEDEMAAAREAIKRGCSS